MSPPDPNNGRVDWLRDELRVLSGKVENQSVTLNAVKSALDILTERWTHHASSVQEHIKGVESDFTVHLEGHRRWSTRLVKVAIVLIVGAVIGGGGTGAFLRLTPDKVAAILTVLNSDGVQVKYATPSEIYRSKSLDE